MKTKIVRKILIMDRLLIKEEEVEIKEIIENKMEEGNQEDRIEVPVIKEIPEDNLKNTTDLSQDNLRDTTNPSPIEENLDPSPIKDNLALSLDTNQKKE